MKVSLITATYNSAKTVRKTFESVAAQRFDDLEYIVVDGASTDETLKVVDDFSSLISKFISEPDRGIYDALNKGIHLATGDVIGFLHSDDFFANPEVISSIAGVFENPQVDACYADLDYVNRENPDEIIRKWRSAEFDASKFYKGWMPAHPTFYLRREHYLNFGAYNLDFRLAADYELMLRMLVKHRLKAEYIPEVVVKMRVGGESNVSLSNRWKANKEDAKAWRVNGLQPKFYTRFAKPLSKLLQYL